ncbi:MAG: LysR family transcriptional regulator [Silicimonas sp.]|nr:LysR family transcriptional regulator [Silicimonas sp.]
MAIKIEMLRTFSTVAQTGNLAEAAMRLGRTPSAVSMTLKQLEDHLGQRLFESERKNRLTPLGTEIFALSQEQIRQFDTTVGAIETSARSPHGLIRIASVPSVAGLVFPSAIQTLTDRHPGLKVELRDADTEQIIRALLQGQADLGIVSGKHTLNGVRSIPLFEDRFGLITAPAHPIAVRKKTVTIDDVSAAGFISNNLCDMIETPAVRRVIAEAHISVPNTLSLIAMVRTGTWVTILPETVAHILPNDLAFRRIKGLSDRRPVTALLRERATGIALAEDLARIVQKRVSATFARGA